MCIFAVSKFLSGTIPQAQKVCCFCIHTYGVKNIIIYRIECLLSVTALGVLLRDVDNTLCDFFV